MYRWRVVWLCSVKVLDMFNHFEWDYRRKTEYVDACSKEDAGYIAGLKLEGKGVMPQKLLLAKKVED